MESKLEFLTEVTEESLPKVKNRYYKFGASEVQVGDQIAFGIIESISDDGKLTSTLQSFVVDTSGILYQLSENKLWSPKGNTADKFTIGFAAWLLDSWTHPDFIHKSPEELVKIYKENGSKA